MTTIAPFTPYCRHLIEQQGWNMVNDRATRARICMAWAINAFETTQPAETTQPLNALQGPETTHQRTQDGFGRQDMVDGDGRG